jgi:hypothetical protein
LKNAFWGIHLPGSPGVEFLSPERRKTYQALTIAEDAVAPDTKMLIEKLKFQLPSQPPPRLVALKESYEIEVPTVR